MNLAISIILGLTTATSAGETKSPAAQQTPVEKPKSTSAELICKTDPVLGSRIKKKRTCLTREDWAFQAEQANDALNGVSRDY